MVWYVAIGLYFWELFKLWISTLFVAPFTHKEMLWLLVPIWATWFFAEFFQEKHGTSMGNAITNSVVVIWGSIDCTRQTVALITSGVLTSVGDMVLRFVIIAIIFGYGAAIVVLGLKGNKIIKYIGRVREVTYAFAMFAPVFYNAVPLTVQRLVAAILFFPLFYVVIEFLDYITPNPKAVEEDIEEKVEPEKGMGGLGESNIGGGMDDMGSTGGSSDLGSMGGPKQGKPKQEDFGNLKF